MPRHMTPAERLECVALYATGHTLDSLAERYDRARHTISSLIARRGAKRFWSRRGRSLSASHREACRVGQLRRQARERALKSS